MWTSGDEQRALAHTVELEPVLAQLESCVAGLHTALMERDVGALEERAAALQAALQEAVLSFKHAARHGGVPPALRQRLAIAGAGVAAHRDSLARATAALDRAIDVLLPGTSPGLYGAQGTPEAPRGSGSLLA